ncbi:MAG: nucleotidyltransferase domain-containing protein, partial [Comamonas sp.]|nr:nucleotidyltransferase domain-containing protein [Comamonas sp.]
RSPVVYCSNAHWVARLHELALQSFSPVRGYHHYLSMARKTMNSHLRADSEVVKYKKYFYALRPLLAARWIREVGGVPPMRFAELATALLHDAYLLKELNALLAVKMRAGEAATSAPWPRIQAFLQAELALAEQYAPQAGPPSTETVHAVDAFLLDAVAHFNTE